MHAWSSSHGRLQGGNDNKNAKNSHIKEIRGMLLHVHACTCTMYNVYTPPPIEQFSMECFRVREGF